MKDVGKLHTGNDKLGIANHWMSVPDEIPRPKAAVEADRKAGLHRTRYLKQLNQYNRSRAPRSQQKSDAEEQTGK